MAETIIRNTGDFTAVYEGEDVVFSTNEVSTTIITGITATKAADKEYWISGPLTYTITVTNSSEVAISDLVLTDTIDANTVFDEDFGVLVNGTAATYTITGAVLTVALPTLAGTGEQVTVTFRVSKV